MELLDRFPTKEAFDEYWNENYVEVVYEDVKDAFENFVNSCDKRIFLTDYEEAGAISEEDFSDNLAEAAKFEFEDAFTDAFYEKNKELYEIAFELYESSQLMGKGNDNVAVTFHKEYNRLYNEFLHKMFKNCYC